jgi:class 3 adenylate cyclase
VEHNKKSKSVEQYISILDNYREVTALFIFADIRGFGNWGKQYPQEIRQLLEIEYSLARRFFDGSRKKLHRKKLVKFVGDGFFAANEVGENTHDALTNAVIESADDILDFVGYFNKAVSDSLLHNRHGLGVGFGMSFGIGYRFNLTGFGTDYVGVPVNLASRLCSAASPSELVLEDNLGECAKEAFKERLNTLQIKPDQITVKEIDNYPVYRVQRLYEELKKPKHYVGVNKLVTTIKKRKKANMKLPPTGGRKMANRRLLIYNYVRKINSDTWHWCRNCSLYPTGQDVEIHHGRPSSGELCKECHSQNMEGTCRP